MKRLICLALVISILLCCFTVTSSAYNRNSFYKTESINRFKGLIDALGIDSSFPSAESEVTREAYTRILMSLMNLKGSSSAAAHGFSDVDDETLNFMLSHAVNTGIISKAEYFNPERTISYAEAIKMAVSALGYSIEAEASGGYPHGYLLQSAHLRLTSGIEFNQNSPLTYENMFILLDNFVNTDIRIQVGFGEKQEYQVVSGRNVLTEYFKLKNITGIIEADEYTSLYDKKLTSSKGNITISGADYLYNGNYVLGTKVNAYVTYEEADNKILYMHDFRTNTKTLFPLDKPYAANGYLYYGDEEVRISSHAAVLFNGEAYISYQDSDFSIKSGNIVLIDNNDDQTIDVIHINKSDVFVVAEVNKKEGLIFVDGGAKVIDLMSNKRYCKILVDGYISDITSINKENIISCYYNKSDEPVCISVSTKQISGLVNEIVSNEEYISIDGNKYNYNEYFKTNHLTDIKPGVNIGFMLDSNGYITSLTTASTEMVFGYMAALKGSLSLSDTPQMKIFTQGGEVKIYNLASKVRIDSKKPMPASEAVALPCFYKESNVKEQLIRYMLNADGEICQIDTEFSIADHDTGIPTTGFYDKSADAFDSLIRYAFNGSDTAATIPYKTTGVMVPYFYMSVYTPVIVVNTDTSLSDEERFTLTTRNVFIKDRGYVSKNLLPYNVKEDGGVEILVYYDEAGVGNAALDTESEYGVVESFNTAIIPATGEIGYRLSVFNGTDFKDIYIKDISTIERLYTGSDKQKGELPLSAGDFIRYIVDVRGIVKGIEKDYDESNKKIINYGNTGDNSTLRYDIGKVYSKSTASMLMISSTTDVKDIKNGTAVLKCINTSNIGILYDSKTKKVSPASYDDIIPYIYSPEMCSTVLIRNRYALGYMFVIYK